MTRALAPARWIRVLVLSLVGALFAVPLVSMAEFTLREGNGHGWGHWADMLHPARPEVYAPLWQGLRNRRPIVHRVLGRLYGLAILISGASGLWLAATTMAGPVAAFGFGLLAVLWLGTTGRGISLAIRGDRVAHRRWMIRSIALTLAAVTLRIQIPMGMMLDIPFDTAYPAIA